MNEEAAREDLTLEGGWRLGEAAFAALLEALRGRRVSWVLEFGSGVSTVRLALALPEVRVVAIDHDPAWAAVTRALAEKHGVADRVEVHACPLRWQWLAGGPYLTYAQPPVPPAVDVLIVDGPPAWTFRGREACLYLARRALGAGALVVLDDCARPDEQVAVRNWSRAFPERLHGRAHDVGHGLWIGEVAGPLGAPRPSPARLGHAWASVARRARLRLVEAVRPGAG